MNAYSRKHTPVPRTYEPGGIISKSELERSKESLIERIASPEEMEEIYRVYGRPTMKLKDRRGFGGGAA
jgi:hypothetical protein